MSIENLDKIFQPNSIAVVGASERGGSVGAALMRNLIERGILVTLLTKWTNYSLGGRKL